MSKILCNQVDYLLRENAAVAVADFVEPKTGFDFINIPVKEKPVYSTSVKQANAGTVRTETVTVVTKHNADTFIKANAAWHYILRLRTDKRIFYAGTDRFPCTVEISGDAISDTYAFKSTSIP